MIIYNISLSFSSINSAPVVTAPAPQVVAPTVAYSYLPYALNYGYNAALPAVVAPYASSPVSVARAPAPVAAAPVAPAVVPAPAPSTQKVVLTHAVPTTHQFHAQDEFGQYQFGYTEPQSSRVETKTADGVVTGRYNYIDSDGVVQTVEYIADALGFRVAGTNIPQHNVVGPVDTGVAPLPVVDTPEVIAAKQAHLSLLQEAKAAAPEVVVVPNAIPESIIEEAAVAEVVAPVEAPVQAPVERDFVVPYVPAPVPTLYKPADPVKVAAAVESQVPAVESVPLAQIAYTVGSSAPAVAAPVIPPQVFVANPSVAAPLPIIAPQPQVYAAPAPVAAAPAPVVAQPQVYYAQAPIAPSVISPVVVPSYMGGHAHHAQDEFGQYQYGYTNEDSTKLEQRMADGSVRGTYSYIDANGKRIVAIRYLTYSYH